MGSGKLSLLLDKESETAQTPRLWLQLLHLESCYCCSLQSVHRQTVQPKHVKRPPGALCCSKTPWQVVFPFHVDATLQREAQISVKTLRYPEELLPNSLFLTRTNPARVLHVAFVDQ